MAELHDLFCKKLQQCCVLFDFLDCVADLKGKEIKRAALNELVESVATSRGVLIEPLYPEAIKMVGGDEGERKTRVNAEVFFFLQSKHNQTIAIIQAKTVTKSGCGGRANRSIAKPREIQGARNIFLQMNQSSSSATPRGCTHGTGRDELRKRRKQGRKRERRQVGMRVSLWGAPEILKRADNNRKERAVEDEGDRHDYDYLYCLHRKLL